MVRLARYILKSHGSQEGQGLIGRRHVSVTRKDSAGESDALRRMEIAKELSYERYRFILQQINAINENVYRFLAIYQALMTALVGAEIALFLGYRRWGLTPYLAHNGVLALLVLETAVACFTVLMIAVGVLAWFDYRNEECDLTDRLVGEGFRSRPKKSNFFRWYETYIVSFIAVSIGLVWGLSLALVLPGIK
jgi:hypothetical protein